jgi:chromosome segregation ATPase
VTAVKKLAKTQHSAALAQLASRISAAVRLGASSGDDVFAKVKSLITDMIAKLQKEAAEEAELKEYCDEETAKSDEKKNELTDDTDKLKAKIDQSTAKSANLKSEVAALQKDLAELASLQSEMDKMRTDENAAYLVVKADLEKGVAGVGAALQVLREYYGSASLVQQPSPPSTHSASGDAGGSIISMLEVAESDFSKNLAQANMEEEDAQSTYDKQTQENKQTKTMKTQDAKYKAAEAKSLDKTVSELSSDLGEKQTELTAVLDYRAKLDEKCVKKPETYEERKARREAEINGLKDALQILETEAAFLQRPRRLRRTVH